MGRPGFFLYVAAPDHFLCECAQKGFLPKLKTDGSRSAEEQSLPEPDVSRSWANSILVPLEVGPVRLLVYVYSPLHMRPLYVVISAMGKG